MPRSDWPLTAIVGFVWMALKRCLRTATAGALDDGASRFYHDGWGFNGWVLVFAILLRTVSVQAANQNATSHTGKHPACLLVNYNLITQVKSCDVLEAVVGRWSSGSLFLDFEVCCWAFMPSCARSFGPRRRVSPCLPSIS